MRKDQEWISIPYREIQSWRGPETKEEISGVTVQSQDDRVVYLPIKGARGKFRDAFLFEGFLRCALQVTR